MPRFSRAPEVVLLCVLVLCCLASVHGAILIKPGTYGGLHWKLTITQTTVNSVTTTYGALVGDCSSSPQFVVSTYVMAPNMLNVSFSTTLTLKYGSPPATVQVACLLCAYRETVSSTSTSSFLYGGLKVTNSGYYEEFNSELGNPASLFTCMNSVSHLVFSPGIFLLLSFVALFTLSTDSF